ncbi:MAG: PAS domain S-box protein [Mariprofundaceae bacterium]|nr:PAS domain S-box protein [Mariprofundaceae bacterium]
MDASVDAIFIFNYKTLKFIDANMSAVQSVGYTKSELLQLAAYDLKPDYSKDQLLALFQPLIVGEKKEVFLEASHRKKDGSLFPVEIYVSTIFDGVTPVVFVASVRDMTERKVIEAQLKMLGQALDQNGEVVIITDQQGIIEYVNRDFTQITGFSSEEAIGENPRILKSSAQDPSIYRDLWETISKGVAWSGTIIDKLKNGSFYPTLLSVTPILNEKNEVMKYISIQQDLTEFKLLEQQFQQAQKLEALGRLVGGIAHDFNNMLAGIMGNTYLARLKIQREKHDEVVDHLHVVDQLCEKAAAMIKKLLAFARKGRIEKTTFALIPFITEAVRLSKVGTPEDVLISVIPSSEEIWIHGDANLLHQVIINLLNNARDALEGVEKPSIVVECRIANASDAIPKSIKTNRTACLTISDNDCGISKENVEKVFEPFFSTKAVNKGTGLGLAMSYGAIQSHNGVIHIDSNAEKGTCFSILLPMTENIHDVESINLDAATLGNHECILIADDD